MILSEKHPPNRLGIFFFFDKDGIVDPYVNTLLEGIRPHLAELLVVSNGALSPEGDAALRQHCDKVLVRGNSGFDVGAYKDAMEHYGWDTLAGYDELILFNYTVFGPLYPFAETFDKMDAKDLDFWGLTMHNGAPISPWFSEEDEKAGKSPVLPVHLQSHFIAVRQSLLQSPRFRRYWETMPKIKTYGDSIKYHETAFTKFFEKKGFKWEASVDTTDITQEDATFPLVMIPLDLIKNRRCPIIKRRSFFRDMEDTLFNSIGEVTVKAFDYIKTNLDYDTELIWQNILRCCNQADIKNALQLNYILAPQAIEPAVEGQPSVALLLHIYYVDLIEECLGYAASMPEYADIYITTGTEEKRKLIEKAAARLLPHNKVEVRLVPNRGRDVSAFLVGMGDVIPRYDYLCFAHDKKGDVVPKVAGESFSFLDFEGILHSKGYVQNILSLFQQNPRLGLLTPPPPVHSSYFAVFGHEWSTNFEGCVQLAEALGLHVDMDANKQPISPLGSEFWFRGKALKPLLDYGFTYEDFPDDAYYKHPGLSRKEHLSHQIERIHSFVVQSEGYYPAWVMPEHIAGLEITMLNYYAREMTRAWPLGRQPYGLSFPLQLKSMRERNKMRKIDNRSMQRMQKDIRWLQRHNSRLERELGKVQLERNQLRDINADLHKHISRLENLSLVRKIKRHFFK